MSNKWFLLAAAPFVIMLYVAGTHGCNLPFQDQWHFIPTLEKSYSGELGISDLFEQHNEHRIFFPKLVMVALARMTHWNIQAEVWLNVLITSATFVVIVLMLRWTMKSLHTTVPPWLYAVMALVLFSSTQTENWIWGWQCQILMSVLAVVLGIAILQRFQSSWPGLVLAVVAGIVATFSFSNGAVFWIAALPSVALVPTISRRVRATRIAFWIVSAALVMCVYMYGYTSSPKFDVLLENPGWFVAYALAFLGSLGSYCLNATVSSSANVVVSVVLGVAGVTMGAALTAMHLRSRTMQTSILAPYWSLALYALGSACMAALGRIGHVPLAQATTSRYTTIAAFLWIACVVLTYLYSRTPTWKPRHTKLAQGLLIGLLIIQQLGAVYCVADYARKVRYERIAMRAIRAGGTDPLLYQIVCPGRPDLVESHRSILESRQLSVFRQPLDKTAVLQSTALDAREAAQDQLYPLVAALYRAGLMIEPENVSFLTSLATVNFMVEDWEGARASLDTILTLNPDDAVAHSNVGVVLGRLGRYEEAFAHFERARELAPTTAAVYLKEGALRAQLNQVEAARNLFNEAARLEPGNPAIQDALSTLSTRSP